MRTGFRDRQGRGGLMRLPVLRKSALELTEGIHHPCRVARRVIWGTSLVDQKLVHIVSYPIKGRARDSNDRAEVAGAAAAGSIFLEPVPEQQFAKSAT